MSTLSVARPLSTGNPTPSARRHSLSYLITLEMSLSTAPKDSRDTATFSAAQNKQKQQSPRARPGFAQKFFFLIFIDALSRVEYYYYCLPGATPGASTTFGPQTCSGGIFVAVRRSGPLWEIATTSGPGLLLHAFSI